MGCRILFLLLIVFTADDAVSVPRIRLHRGAEAECEIFAIEPAPARKKLASPS
jgi:hypothetical protein